MTRLTVGGTANDFLFVTRPDRSLALPASTLTLTWWTQKTGGTQLTGLILDGATVNSVPVVGGIVPKHQWPDGVTEAWADAGNGRVLFQPGVGGGYTKAEIDAQLSGLEDELRDYIAESLGVTPGGGTGGTTGLPSGKITIGAPPREQDTQFWAGVYDLNHTLPAGIAVGNRIVVACLARPSTVDFPSTLTDNFGGTFTRDAEPAVGGAGTFGVDTGPAKIVTYSKISTGGETNVTVPQATGPDVDEATFSGLVSSYVFTKEAADAWEPIVATFAQDNLDGTDYSAEAAGNLSFTTDDVLVAVTGLNSDTALPTDLTLTVPGCTLGTPVTLQQVGTPGGNDSAVLVRAVRVTGGTSTGAPKQVATLATPGSGVTAFLKLRTTIGANPDPEPEQPTTGTITSAPIPYPAKVAAIYFMLWKESNSPLLDNLPTSSGTGAGFNVIDLAFAQFDPPRLVGFASESSDAVFISKINAKRAAGIPNIVSIGGGGGYVNTANRQAFVNGIMAINSKVPVDGIDWDIESGTSFPAADALWISAELKRLRGPNFAVTMAPNGTNRPEYLASAVQMQNAGLLTMYGQQFYDAPVTKEAARDRISQAKAAGIPESKICIGIMLGSDPAKYWTLATALTNINYLKGQFPALKGAYLWESSRTDTGNFATQAAPLLKS